MAVRVGMLVAASAAGAPSGAGPAPAAVEVAVDANRFAPFEVQVAPGGTVTWDVREGGHTIVADDGGFDFRGPDGADLSPGERPSHVVGHRDEVIRYHCTVHGGPGGQGMAGVLVVGDPAPVVPDVAVIRVPRDATLAGAVAAAQPGTRIEVSPGRHVLDDVLEVDLRDDAELPHGLEVVGLGARPEDVVVDLALTPQRGPAPAVVRVTGAFVTLSNLTVVADGVRPSGAAIHLDAADQAALDDVVIEGGGFPRDGVRVSRASGAGLRDVRIRGVRRAGIRVDPCASCGVLVEGVDVADVGVGVLVAEARGVAIRGSRLEGNGAGIVVLGGAARASTVTVADNLVRANQRRVDLPAPTDPDRRLVVGAGVWLDGAADASVTGNRVEGNRFGVVLSGGARHVVVTDNDLGGNTTDLAWDGLGAHTCFERNEGVRTSSPPFLAEVHPCDRPTLGLPWPFVTAALVTAAYA